MRELCHAAAAGRISNGRPSESSGLAFDEVSLSWREAGFGIDFYCG